MKWLLLLLLLVVLAAWLLWTPDRSVENLQQRYLRAPDDFVQLADIRLHVRDDGPRDASALILLHGLGASLQTWEDWVPSLSEEYRVIRFDLPGFGLTGPDPTGDYSDERSIELLLQLMTKLAIDQATLIGNSLGGRIAWRFAAAHPERMDKLVLISPDGFASPGFEYEQAPEIPAAMSLMRYSMPKWLLAMNLKPAYADAAVVTPELLTRYHDLLLYPGNREAVLQRLRQVELPRPQPLLQQITAPVLLLWGEQDALIPVSNAEDYAAVLEDSEIHVLAGIGHLPQEEAPQASLQPLLSFLRAH